MEISTRCLALLFVGLSLPSAVVQGSIVGGTDAAPGDFQGFARPVRPNPNQLVPVCGAMLIARDIAVTAAHCNDGDPAAIAPDIPPAFPMGEMVGIRQADGTEEIYTIDMVVRHPGYMAGTFDNDIMLFRISQLSGHQVATWNTNPAVQSIGSTLDIMGFGLTSPEPNPVYPVLLQKVQVQARDGAVCDTSYPGGYNDTIMLCAGSSIGGVSSCIGDSGSPIIDVASSTVVGVVSFGKATCDDAVAYTRLSAFDTWIQQNLCE